MALWAATGALPVKEASRAAWLGWSGGESRLRLRLPSARQHRTAVTHEATHTSVVDRTRRDASFVNRSSKIVPSYTKIVRNNLMFP